MRLYCLAISLMFLSVLSSTQLRFMAQGRAIPHHKKYLISQEREEENKAIVRARIGSRPPRCERRCISCGHCEAIQVPTNPQVKFGNNTKKKSSSSNNSNSNNLVSNVEYARGDYNSNYKPMSWKCKCGDFIFNP